MKLPNLTVARPGFSREDRGATAVIFAVVVPVLVAIMGGSIDYSRAMRIRVALQDSLDAAALAVARSDAVTEEEFQAIGEPMLEANLSLRRGVYLKSSTFIPTGGGRIVNARSEAEMDASIMGVFTGEKIIIAATSEVVRASRSVEVSLVLDTTGSMEGQKISDLKVAAKQLVDVVVGDQQTPFYSKVALVPYSMAVNVGSYAEAARGSVTPGTPITGATRGDPVVVTAANHGFVNGARVRIKGVGGMTKINNVVDKYVDPDQGRYREFTVANRTTNTFQLSGINGTGFSSYTGGGSVFCTTSGCQHYSFQNADSGARRNHEISTCVTERTGTNAYTDAKPSTAPLGRNYPSTENPCLTNTISPLSPDKPEIGREIDKLNASGSTGGHVGIGWGWYLIAPNFDYMFPTLGKPGAYNTRDLVKSVVIMTDGEYNSSYCNGVISRDSTSGSGESQHKINCNAPNGSAFTQSTKLCTEMKKKGVVVYTVGLNIVNDQRARDLVNNCASGPKYVFFPNSGTELKSTFNAIGLDINRLRLSM